MTGGLIRFSTLFLSMLLILSSTAFSQRSLVTNTMKYGNGSEVGLSGEARKEYFENISDVRLLFPSITVGFRLEISDPPEYGIPAKGVTKKFVEYGNNDITIRAGDLYTLFQRGTSLNLFENRTLGYDSGLEGVKISYENSYVSMEAVGGKILFVDPFTVASSSPRREEYSLKGGTVSFSPIRSLKIGTGLIGADALLPNLFRGIPDTVRAVLPEYTLSFIMEEFDLFASYTTRTVDVNGRMANNAGSGFYAAASYSGDGYGVTTEYKDYRFDIIDPSGADPFRPTRMMGFQNPPTVHKEHSATSLSRYPHLTDFNDEVGIQIDAFISLLDGMTINLNAAASSRHYEYILDRWTFISSRTENGSPLLPSFSNSRSPFWELYADAEYFFIDGLSYLKAALDRRSEYLFNEFGSTVQRQTTVPLFVQYTIDGTWSIKTNVEMQWVYDNKYPTHQNFFNFLTGVQLSHSPDWSIGIRRDITDSPYDPTRRSVWIVAECSYRIGTAHTASMSYGSERGGQVCTNGICRQVNPFSGLRIMLSSQL